MGSMLPPKRSSGLKLPRCVHLFIYTILEWIMIMLILLDGCLAFISHEFARFFKLNVPCLLCTRINYIMSLRKSNFCYNDSICEEHKRDISSLAYCHVHRKISDIRQMCESCLLSFANDKDSDCKKNKSLLGILHKDIGGFVDDGSRVHVKSSKTSEEQPAQVAERCACCGEVIEKLKFMKRCPSMSAIAPAPSPRIRRNERVCSIESPRIRFSDIKMISDNESELPDEEDASIIGGRDDTKSEGIQEDYSCRTPSFLRGNRFFPLSDSVQSSPRVARLLSDSNETAIPNEGDSEDLNKLKKQVRLDHKSLMALKTELDEERNASAIAANNAIAMISRLQDEKAALQMEALQYQRMMEEEVEFDQEEVMLMKDMLIRNEKEMNMLASELQAYRLKYGPIERIDGEAYEVHGDEDYQELRSHFLSSFDMSECPTPVEAEAFEHSGNLEESSVHYEFDENSHFSDWLTNGENKTISASSD